MQNITATALPNPNTPLAFLDPKVAYQTSVSIYVLAGSAGVLVWDVVENLISDYKLLFTYRISFATVVYFVSRIGSLGYVIASNIFETAPTGRCAAFETITDSFYPLALGASALLFFLRLRAIYNRDPIVVFFFFLLWLALVGTTMIVPIVIIGGNIGSTQYCIDTNVPSVTYAALLSPLIHDTLVFFAISWRLVTNAHRELDIKEGIKTILFGKYLPSFSRGLLKDGQKYYLISLISNLIAVIMVFNTRVPIPMRSMCVTPNIVLTNIMACRVYRNTKFGFIRETEVSTTTQDRRSQRLPMFPIFARGRGKGAPTATTTAWNTHDSDYPLSDITTKLRVDSEAHGIDKSLDSKSPDDQLNLTFPIDDAASQTKAVLYS